MPEINKLLKNLSKVIDAASQNDQLHQLESELKEAINSKFFYSYDSLIKKIVVDFFHNNFKCLSINTKLISRIVKQFTHSELTEKRIKELSREIFRILDHAESSLSLPSPVSHYEPIPIGFICDIDAPDHNGSALNAFNSALAVELPIITTRVLFRSANNEGFFAQTERDQAMPKTEKNYEIYASGAFLIFVPKALNGVDENERIKNMDLNSLVLHQITLEEAWRQTDEKPTFEGFQNLFSNDPKQDKFIYIAGHGGVGRPGGLTAQHYTEFLEWAKKQRCQGLLISSCYSGGESTQLHFPKEDLEKHRFMTNKPKGVPFPIFAYSTGDFPIITQREKDVRSFFSSLSTLLKRPGGLSLPCLRQAIQKLEEGKKNKDPKNLLQVYFPHSEESPGGFRPLGEEGAACTLTYAYYRQQQIENKCIRISDKHFVQLSPVVIQSPIVIEGLNPTFFSMVPGKAHHFLAEVILDGSTPQDFLRQNALSYKSNNVGVQKTFFISSLHSSDKELNKVFIDLKNGECGFQEEGKYFFWNAQKNNTPVNISPFQYLLKWKGILDSSQPNAAALRRATGGQQGNKDLESSLLQDSFWGPQQPIFDRYSEILQKNRVLNLSLEELRRRIHAWQLTKSEIISLIDHLLIYNEALACSLFREESLPADSRGETAIPLLITAAKNNCINFMKLLIENKADLNLPDPRNGDTCLAIALVEGYTELAHLLLEQDSVNLEAIVSRGNLAFMEAIFTPDILRKVLAKKPNLNLNVLYTTRDNNIFSLLGAAIFFAPIESLTLLLDSGADPNWKKSSSLAEAIILGNREKISLLLRNGANPYQKDLCKRCPIIEAMYRSSFSVVEELLHCFDEKTKDLEPLERQTLLTEIFFSALESGEEAKVRLVLAKNPSFPPGFKYSKDNLVKSFNRLFLFGKIELIQEVRKKLKNYPELDAVLISLFLEESPQILVQCMDASWNLSMVIDMTIKLDQKNLTNDIRQQIILKAITLGVDINKPAKGSDTPLAVAMILSNQKLARYLLENGADPSSAQNWIAKHGDPDLIKFAWEHGLRDQSSKSNSFAFLFTLIKRSVEQREIREVFKWIVEQGGVDIHEPCKGTTPFFKVISSGVGELYDFCLKYGGNKALENKGILSNLARRTIKSKGPDWEYIVKDLVKKGADLNEPLKKKTQFGTLFSMIAYSGSLDLISWCIDRGADLNPNNSPYKIQPLFAAGSRPTDARRVFELLLERGADINPPAEENIVPVITKGDLEFVQFCFNKGAILSDYMTIKKCFVNAFYFSSNPEVVAELIRQGYSFSMEIWEAEEASQLLWSAYQSGGFPMLAKACEFKPSKKAIAKAGNDILKSIIANNDLNAMRMIEAKSSIFDLEKILKEHEEWLFPLNKLSEVALELFSRMNDKDRTLILTKNVYKLLIENNIVWFKYALENGADPNLKVGINAETPLIFMVLASNDSELVKIILQAKPDLNVTISDITPLEYAKKFCHNSDIVKLFAATSPLSTFPPGIPHLFP